MTPDAVDMLSALVLAMIAVPLIAILLFDLLARAL